jgi:AcrR family transcriptional regulator
LFPDCDEGDARVTSPPEAKTTEDVSADASEAKPRRARPRAKHMGSAEREAYIVRRAIECFATHGFGVSTRDLAKHVGVAQPLLYHYFGSKENLVDRVYREVFFSRWNPDWEEVLADTSKPLEERLVTCIEDYTRAILSNDWVRLFVFAALDDPGLNKRYITLLHERIFKPVLREIRSSKGLPPEPTEIDLELFWGFHSSFFYMGMRRWIYRMDIPDDLRGVIRAHVHNFLFGYPVTLMAGYTEPAEAKQANNNNSDEEVVSSSPRS